MFGLNLISMVSGMLSDPKAAVNCKEEKKCEKKKRNPFEFNKFVVPQRKGDQLPQTITDKII